LYSQSEAISEDLRAVINILTALQESIKRLRVGVGDQRNVMESSPLRS
jgi:hypothetical protein